MASSGNPNHQPQPQPQPPGVFNLFKPSSSTPMAPPPTNSNLSSSPSFPSPSPSSSTPPFLTPSSSYPPPSGPYPFHYLPSYHPQDQPQPQPQFIAAANMHLPRPISYPSPNPSAGGARLMALLGTQTPPPPPPPSNLDFSQPSPLPSVGSSEFLLSNAPAIPSPAPQRSPSRLLSTKLPKGRHLIGDHVAYDLDVRLPGEVQPQLEVTPITKYASDPGLVVGRQIAVNRTYICYGLKLGNIRVLNIDTASRSLLRGHTQRVTDMTFFAEDVHFLASVSVDGRLFIWKISEGSDEEDKPQIAGKIILAIQIMGVGESVHPRVSWHPHKQEILMVAIGSRILKIDTIKAAKVGGFSAEEPLKCPIDRLIDGVQFIGKHDAEITELSMCQWMTSRLASASTDGTVMVWEDRKTGPVAVLKPHGGEPVNSVTFLTAPHRPDHIVLITAGHLNREVKIWTSASEEGWLLPGEAEAWQCTQTLELKSSGEPRIEDAFFNQVVALPRAGLYLLANAKKNAIYAVHIDYGNYPAATRMDYIAEFTVTMPILSLTGTSDSLADGEHVIQVYCVQTQAIQQYALNLSQCLPPPLGNLELEKTESNISRAYDAMNTDGSTTQELSQAGKPKEIPVGNEASLPTTLSSTFERAPINLTSSEVTGLPQFAVSGMETKTTALPSRSNTENIPTASPSLPLSPRLSGKSSGFMTPYASFEPSSPLAARSGDQPVHDFSVDQRKSALKENKSDAPSSGDNSKKDDTNLAQNDISVVPSSSVTFKHPTHLITPSEILSTVASSSENAQISQAMNVGEARVQDVVVSNDTESAEVEVKVVDENRSGQDNEFNDKRESLITVPEKKEKAFYSQASDLGIQMARESVEAMRQADQLANSVEAPDQPSSTGEVQEMMKNVSLKVGEPETSIAVQQSPVPATKGKRQKGKNTQVSGSSSPLPSPFDSTDSSNEQNCISGTAATDGSSSQLLAMQETLEQLMSMQKEMQKQMNVMVSVPVTKEGRRLEASLGRNMEKVVKANADALWARFLEENAKHEKLERDRVHQITNLISNCINKDLPTMLEKTVKKEIAAVASAVARTVTPIVEKSISVAVTESFQKGVGDKAVNQLEKSVSTKLEATVARQIQAQFQTSGKQALQDALRASLEASIVPAFEVSCKSMFEQVDATFQKGLIKHTSAYQQQLESTLSPLAATLRDTINSASSISKTLSAELAEGQRKILAFAAGANLNPMVPDNGTLPGLHDMQPEAPIDPTKELSRLISERKFEEAFAGALHRSDVSIVSWLCSQVDLQGIVSMVPLPLSQGVLLALLQQLACDISNETPRKLQWMTDVAVVINPADPTIAMHVRPIFEQVYQILSHQRNYPTTSAPEANSIRLLMHVINSVLMTCK